VFYGLQYVIDLFSINNTFVLNFSVLNNSEILMVGLNSSISFNNRTESIQPSKPDLIGLVIYIVIFFFVAFGFLLIYTFIINKKKKF
jgi:ABC-type multidrug transport system permease subunit